MANAINKLKTKGAYRIKRSSLCGKNEQKKTKSTVGKNNLKISAKYILNTHLLLINLTFQLCLVYSNMRIYKKVKKKLTIHRS